MTFNSHVGCQAISPGCANCYAADWAKRYGRDFAVRQRTSEQNWKLPIKWNKKAGQGLFVECAACGTREFRGRVVAFGESMLECCSKKGCLALPESESNTVRPRVFCSSLADVFDNEVLQEWRQDLWNLIEATPHLDWLLLTKRIGNVSKMIPDRWCVSLPKNVWIGITVVNQEEADRDIPKLLQIPARIRWISAEPLLESVDIRKWLSPWTCSNCNFHGSECENNSQECPNCGIANGWSMDLGFKFPSRGGANLIDWVVVGGESGSNARPMHPDWVRSLRDQCVSAGVPFLFKQWGEWAPDNKGTHTKNGYESVRGNLISDNAVSGQFLALPENPELDKNGNPRFEVLVKVGKKKAGRTLEGRTWDEYPQ
jgi:protein gp37